MEKMSKGQPYSKIIELTADKEITAQSGGRIIDLTRALESNRPTSPLQPPQPESVKTSIANIAHLTNEAKVRKQTEIDSEIDRAFEIVQKVENRFDPEEKPDSATELPQLPSLAKCVEPAQSNWAKGPQRSAHDPECPKVAEDLDFLPDAEEIIDLEEIVTSEVSEAQGSSAEDPEAVELLDGAEHVDSPAGQTPVEVSDSTDPESEIIDLVDIVTLEKLPETTPQEEIIDLVDIVTLEKLPETAPQEEIIDLVDIVTLEKLPETTSKEEIIDLVDIVTLEKLPETAPQEEIIDLVDRVSPDGSAQLSDYSAPEAQIEEVDLIALDRLLPSEEDPPEVSEQVTRRDERREAERPSSEITLSQEDELSAELTDVTVNPLEMIGIELSKTEPGTSGLSPQVLEAAIEKILRTKYADHIEHLIAAVVEKTVTREIEQIKREFMDEIDLRENDDER
jgi:hypothetical protein